MDNNIFYVYLLLRLDGSPFYCGKGYGSRWLSHERNAKKALPVRGENIHKRGIIRLILDKGAILQKIKIAENITNEEAVALEVEIIARIGRGANGSLVNLTDGGEGSIGRLPSDETKRKMSRSAILQWNDPSIRSSKSADMIRAYAKNPKLIHAKSVAAVLKATTPEWRAMNAVTRKMAIAANTGAKRTDETRKRMSDAAKSRSVEAQRRISEARWGGGSGSLSAQING